MIRKIITVFIAVLGLFWLKQSFAKIDTRTYEDWGSPPYNMVVRLEAGGSCTGSFIGPYHILTASHCVKNYDDPIHIYTADSGNNGFWATKVYDSKWAKEAWKSTGKADDWAILEVDNKKSHSVSKYFSIAPFSKNYKNVRSVGFGDLRILKDTELGIIRSVLIKLLEDDIKKINDCEPWDDECIKHKTCEPWDDECIKAEAEMEVEKESISSTSKFVEKLEATLSSPDYNIPPIFGDYEKLKVSGPCNILGTYRGYLYGNCEVAQGNSGGPLSSNLLTNTPIIVGVSSQGAHTIGSSTSISTAFFTKPEHFYNEVNKYLSDELSPEFKTTKTTTCKPGEYLKNSNCTYCEAGYKCPDGDQRSPCSGSLEYQNRTGQSSCKSVKAMYYKVENDKANICPNGYRNGPAAENINNCKPADCKKGEYWNGSLLPEPRCETCDDRSQCPGVTTVTYGTRFTTTGKTASKQTDAKNIYSEQITSSEPNISEEPQKYIIQFEFKDNSSAQRAVDEIKNLFPDLDTYVENETRLYKVRINVNPDTYSQVHTTLLRIIDGNLQNISVAKAKCSGFLYKITDFIFCPSYLFRK